MKSAVFIAVRMKSARLLKKAMLEINGRSMIEHLIDRLKLSKIPNNIVLCTSTNPQDTILVERAVRNNIGYFCGSEDDKLSRFLGATKKYGIDLIAAVDGDDIFSDPRYIDKTIQMLKDTDADMVKTDGLPLGIACNGISLKALKEVCKIKKESDTEVWGKYFTDNKEFKVITLNAKRKHSYPDIRLTLDYQEDFTLYQSIFKELYKDDSIPSLDDIIGLFKMKPELLEINRSVQENYLKGIEAKDRKVRW